jgi:hypothetical protein
MPPSLGQAALGMSASGVPPDAASSSRSISSRKIFVTAATARGRSARKPRNRFGTEITHCRTGTGGASRRQGGPSMAPSCLAADGNAKGSHGCQARLSRSATTNPVRHVMQTARAKPKQSSPHSR